MVLGAFVFGVLGFLMQEHLTAPGEVFSWLRKAVNRFTREGKRNKACYWLQRVTVGCAKCIAGNAALWFYLVQFEFLLAFQGAILAIFFAVILNQANKLYEQY